MAVITLIAAKPGEKAPGVPVETLDLWLLNINPVFRWRQEHLAYDVRVIRQGERFPSDCSSLDVQVSDAEYQEYLNAVAGTH